MSVHVACVPIFSGSGYEGSPVLRNNIVWSEALAGAGTTTNAAPSTVGVTYAFVVTTLGETAGVNIAMASSPNAGAEPRFRMANNTTMIFVVNPGDKLAYTVVV